MLHGLIPMNIIKHLNGQQLDIPMFDEVKLVVSSLFSSQIAQRRDEAS